MTLVVQSDAKNDENWYFDVEKTSYSAKENLKMIGKFMSETIDIIHRFPCN